MFVIISNGDLEFLLFFLNFGLFMLMWLKFFLLMFFCYFILKGDGIDDINVLKIVLDLRKILDGVIMIDLGIFIKK